MTKEYFETLTPCSVLTESCWENGWRFVKRGKRWVAVAYMTAAGHVYKCTRIHYNVAIAGRRLAYSRQVDPLKPEPFTETSEFRAHPEPPRVDRETA